MKKRIFSVLIVIVMVIGMIPCSVFASTVKPDNAQNNYGSFVSGANVISSMIKKHGEKAHPRLIMTEDRFELLRKQKDNGSTTATLLAKLKKEADDKLKEHADKPIHFIDKEFIIHANNYLKENYGFEPFIFLCSGYDFTNTNIEDKYNIFPNNIIKNKF